MKIGEIFQENSYSALLRRIEWKRFSSSIRRTRGNVCECCHQSGKTTQVHHLFYDFGVKPWECPECDVVLLCTGCHKELHEQLNAFRKQIFRCLDPVSFQVLNQALAVGFRANNASEFVHAIRELASSPSSVVRFAYAWNNGKRPESAEYNAVERDYDERKVKVERENP